MTSLYEGFNHHVSLQLKRAKNLPLFDLDRSVAAALNATLLYKLRGGDAVRVEVRMSLVRTLSFRAVTGRNKKKHTKNSVIHYSYCFSFYDLFVIQAFFSCTLK